MLVTMGNVRSSSSNKKKTGGKTPQDLSELFQQYEKKKTENAFWLEKFSQFLSSLDTKTKQAWRQQLLEFVVLSREVINTNNIQEEAVSQLQEYLAEGGVGVSDSVLREQLLDSLEDLRTARRGAAGTRRALEDGGAPGEDVIRTLRQVLLDPSVWKTLDDLYTRFLRHHHSTPNMAVLLSIL